MLNTRLILTLIYYTAANARRNKYNDKIHMKRNKHVLLKFPAYAPQPIQNLENTLA